MQFESEFERKLFNERQDKLKKIEKLGQAAYPNRFPLAQNETANNIAKIREKWGDPETAGELEAERVTVAIAGRIMAIRAQGKAGFATLQQDGARLQIYVRLDAVGEQGFALYKLLDLGDHIGVTGYLFRTRTGELTVHVETPHLPGQGHAGHAGEISRPGRRGAALPPALRRSFRQPRQPRSVREARQGAYGDADSSLTSAATSKWKRR